RCAASTGRLNRLTCRMRRKMTDATMRKSRIVMSKMERDSPVKSQALVMGLTHFYFFGCFAITLLAILLYVAWGMIFLLVSSVFILYGRPSMIFWAYASPMPGRAINSSLEAEFKSTNSAVLSAAGVPASFFAPVALGFSAGFVGAFVWAKLRELTRIRADAVTKS